MDGWYLRIYCLYVNDGVIIETCDLIIMNVNRIEQSQKRLNYYSRSSPKKKKNTYFDHSPLLYPNPNQHHTTKRSHHTSLQSHHNSHNSSFKTEIREPAQSKKNQQILIQQSLGEEILIEDFAQQQIDTKVLTDILQQFQDFNQKMISQKQIQQISDSIMIEDSGWAQQEQETKEDNEKQVSYFNLQQARKDNKDSYIKIQNQSQQTMNRQFTFADNAIYWIEDDDFPQQRQKIEYRLENISQEDYDQYHSDIPYFQSNMQYEVAQYTKNPVEGLHLPIAQFFRSDQKEPPRFNTISLRRMSDKWITSQDYHMSLSRNMPITTEHSESLQKSSNDRAIIVRPYQKSIQLFENIIKQVSSSLAKLYTKMYQKLISDKIKAEEQMKYQQQKIKTIKMLISLRRQGLKCQDYLLSQSTSIQQQIQINQVIIHSLINRIKLNSQ